MTMTKDKLDAIGPSPENTSHTHYRKPVLKWKRVLAWLTAGNSVTRFEAERQLADHALPSTVSFLQLKELVIERETVRVPGFQGVPVDCCRYKLAPGSFELARTLLGRGAPADASDARMSTLKASA